MLKKVLCSTLSLVFTLNIVTFKPLAYSRDIPNETNSIDSKNIAWNYDIPELPTPRNGLKTIEHDGKIYCIGGIDGNSNYLGTVEVYDSLTKTWSTKKPMPTPRRNFAMVLIGNEIYCLGGISSGGPSTKVEMYNIDTDKWTTCRNLAIAKGYMEGAVYNDYVYLFGGFVNESATVSNKVTSYHIIDEMESLVHTTMPLDLMGYSLNQDGNTVYITGGVQYSDNISNKIFSYNMESNTWNEIGTMMEHRKFHGSTLFNNSIFIFGGEDYNPTDGDIYQDSTEVFDLSTKISKENIPMDKPRRLSGIQYLNEAIYLIGGETGPGNLTKEVVSYNTSYVYEPTPVEPSSSSSNIDIYIKPENTLSISLDTNSVIFEDFSGIDDIEQLNSINISIRSSLPYEINAYLESDIENADKSNSLDVNTLKIRESSQVDYKEFFATKTKLGLLENQEATTERTHSLDLKLKGGNVNKSDVYKTSLKIEVSQI